MSNNQHYERATLARSLSFKDVLALAFGTMIGWGWIMLAGTWAAKGGTMGAVLAFVSGIIMCIFVGLCYAELTPALPLAGGELAFSYRAMGTVPGWICAWFICFAYVGVAAWEGPAFVTAIEYIFGWPLKGYLWTIAGFDVYLSWVLLGTAAAVLLGILNYRGVKPAAVFQLVATIIMAFGGVAFFVCSITMGEFKNLIPYFTDFKGWVAVMLAVPAMFVGFDVIPQAAEEMNIPLNKISKALIMSICLAGLWYMIMIISIGFAASDSIRAAATGIPVADAFAAVTNSPFVGKLMIVAALCGILTSWNGFFIGATRVLFGMGRGKMLPTVFGKVHPVHKTPVAAILLVTIVTGVSPLLGKGALGWFVDASAFGTVVAYFMVALSFIFLRKKEPDLLRPYKAPGGIVTGVIAVLVSLFFIYLYTPISPNGLGGICWAMIGGWTLLGVIFAIMAYVKFKDTPWAEREYLLLGEYAREKKPGA